MVDFNRSAVTAKRLVEKNGRTVTLVKRNRTPANASQPWRGNAGAPTAVAGGDPGTDVIMAFVPLSAGGDLGLGKVVRNREGRIAVELEQFALMAPDSAPDIDPGQYDQIIDSDGSAWTIHTRQELKPADKSVLWALGVAR